VTGALPPVRLFLHVYSFRFALRLDPAFDVFAVLDRAVAEGYAGVAINVNGPRYRFLGGDDEAHVARVADAVRERGLDLDIETSGTAPAHLATLLGLAARLGARHLRTYTRHAGARADVVARTVADLRAAAPLAERAGIPLLLENHEEFTGREIAAILERVAHPAVGALYDYGNSMMRREDPLDCLDAMLPWTRKAHLKDHVVLAAADAPGGQAVVAGVPIGRGNLDVVETTRRLLAAGMDRIAFENVWSYTAPIGPRQDGLPEQPLGAGAFRTLPGPWAPEVYLPDAEAVAASDPARVVALEARAYAEARAWLASAFAAAGIRAGSNAKPS
jgi:sugar phosphate isomerase/epimerase